jgi:hypothetical protein
MGLVLRSSANVDGARGEPTPVKRAGILLRREEVVWTDGGGG